MAEPALKLWSGSRRWHYLVQKSWSQGMKPSPEQHIQIIVISPNLHIPSTNHLLPAEAEDIVYGQHYLLHLSPLKDENCWTTYIDQSSFKSPTNPKHIHHKPLIQSPQSWQVFPPNCKGVVVWERKGGERSRARCVFKKGPDNSWHLSPLNTPFPVQEQKSSIWSKMWPKCRPIFWTQESLFSSTFAKELKCALNSQKDGQIHKKCTMGTKMIFLGPILQF